MEREPKPFDLFGLLRANPTPTSASDGSRESALRADSGTSPAAVRRHEAIPGLELSVLAEIADAISIPLCIRTAQDLSVLVANAASLACGIFEPGSKGSFQSAGPLSAEARHAARQSAVTRTHAIVEYAWPQASGSPQNFEIHAHPVLDAEGEPLFIVEYLIDVTDRYRATSSHKDGAATLRLMLDSSPNAMTVFNSEGTITYCSRPAAALLGYPSREALVGESIWAFFSPGDREQMQSDVARTLLDTMTGDVECTIAAKGGCTFVAEISSVAIRDKSGEASSFVMFIKDVTERKRFEAMLERRACDLRERIKELNCLIRICRLINDKDRSPERLLEEALKIIPSGWQYPEITCAR
ncbi:MAG TPA: PAS domain S-box protein, partial [Candidatus Bathyarchaeia archaeon]|nr:PAS domain S-box protein [Candidatus Bathyarchaeia archaeon]